MHIKAQLLEQVLDDCGNTSSCACIPYAILQAGFRGNVHIRCRLKATFGLHRTGPIRMCMAILTVHASQAAEIQAGFALLAAGLTNIGNQHLSFM